MKTLTTPNLFRKVLLSLIALVPLVAPPALADTGGVPIDVSVLPGLLTLYASDHASLSSVLSSNTDTQTSTGELAILGVDDSRGTFNGWNVSATFSNLSNYQPFMLSSGEPGPFTAHGAYNDNDDLDLTLAIGSGVNGRGLNQIYYSLVDQNGKHYTTGSVQLLQATQQIGSTGIWFDASDISYLPDTEYHMHVHVIPAQRYTVAPGSLLDDTNHELTPGLTCTPHDQNDPCTLVVAAAGKGNGFYHITSGLSLSVPARTLPGTYSGQIIETIQ